MSNWAENVRFWIGLYQEDGTEVDGPGYARQLVREWSSQHGQLQANVVFGPAGRTGWGPLDGVLLLTDEGQAIARHPFPFSEGPRKIRQGQELEVRAHLTLTGAPTKEG